MLCLRNLSVISCSISTIGEMKNAFVNGFFGGVQMEKYAPMLLAINRTDGV